MTEEPVNLEQAAWNARVDEEIRLHRSERAALEYYMRRAEEANIDKTTRLFTMNALSDVGPEIMQTYVENFKSLEDVQRTSEEDLRQAGIRTVAVTMVDVVGLKAANENISWDEGNRRLKLVADALKKIHTRDSDICVRVGGDEMASLSINGTEEDLKIQQERLKAELEGKQEVYVASMVFDIDENTNLVRVVNKAAEALNDVKKSAKKNESGRLIAGDFTILDRVAYAE